MLNLHPPVSFQFVCVEVSVRSSESCWSGSGEELVLFLLHNSPVCFFQTMLYISGIYSLVSLSLAVAALMLMLFVPFHKLTKHFCVRCYNIWSFRAFSVWNQKFVCDDEDDDSCVSLSKNLDWKKSYLKKIKTLPQNRKNLGRDYGTFPAAEAFKTIS